MHRGCIVMDLPREGEACRAGSLGIFRLRVHEQEPPPRRVAYKRVTSTQRNSLHRASQQQPTTIPEKRD